jgi:tRNA pseudouridine55 synthase
MARSGAAAAQGVAVVDKPPGITSHDAVARVRHRLRTRRVGHAGTLDPLASGVLVVMVGPATKLAPFLTEADKSYRAVVQLGTATDTLDAEGRLTEVRPLPAWWRDPLEAERRLTAAIAAERARVVQVPPTYSAIKVAGRAAHARARAGEELALPPRAVAVRRLECTGRDDGAGRLTLALTVCKGYYVRALARDLGRLLDCPAHLVELRRVASGGFGIDEAIALDAVERASLMPGAVAAARSLPCATLTDSGARRARQGHALGEGDFAAPPPQEGVQAWLSRSGELVAIGAASRRGWVVRRGF